MVACQFIVLSCFNQNDNSISLATITLKNIDCDNCFQELENDIELLYGIHESEMYLSNNKKIILLNIKYDNQKTNIDIINNKIKEYGFNIEGIK